METRSAKTMIDYTLPEPKLEQIRENIYAYIQPDGGIYQRRRKLDGTDEEINAIEKGDQIPLGPKAARLLRFIDECVYSVRVSNETFSDISSLFSEQEIAELTLPI